MNKSELAEAVATSTGVSKAEALASIDAITKVIAKELKGHGSVGLVGFGTFSTTKRAARDGRNPKTGEPLKIKAKTVAKFKPSKDLI